MSHVKGFVRTYGVMIKRDWKCPPNWLTTFRIILCPIPGALYIQGTSSRATLATVLIGIALTDFADGLLARIRKGKWKSELGANLDPLADKIFIIVTYAQISVVNRWMILPTLIVLAREIHVTILRNRIKEKHGVSMPAKWPGKIKMGTQVVAAVLLLMQFPGWFHYVTYASVVVMLAMTIYSWWDIRRSIPSRLVAATT